MTGTTSRDIDCAVAVIGGGLGGCAALGALGEHPAMLSEATDWIGGQITAQGVSALDEHAYIESFGATARYLALRQDIRRRVMADTGAPAIMAESVLGPDLPLNPGNGWVSRLCFLPAYGLAALEAMAGPGERLLNHRPVAATRGEDGGIESVTLEGPDGAHVVVRARYFLDATELGDLLPLAGAAYVTGAEAQSDTGEPSAPPDARPREAQGFTYPFAVEYCPGEDHTIPEPPGYAAFRNAGTYTLSPAGRDGAPVVYRMFDTSESGNLPFWSYRRLHDGALLGGRDISMVNWISNDYHGETLTEPATPDEIARAHDEAKRLSLGFLYWLQTECPRDDGGVGYPEFKLRPDVMDTSDGLSKAPYIRESRRIIARRRVVETDIAAEYNPGARARHVADSVGIGWYAMDLHPCVGNPSASMYAPTRPFQIPLGALIPRDTPNLIAACKNIGTTHLTNGAYRLHPVEWAIGEAAGHLAAYCLDHGLSPHQVANSAWHTWRLQARLVRAGCPVFWAVDVPVEHPLFVPTQLLLSRDLIVPDSPRWLALEIGLGQPLGDDIRLDRLRALIESLNGRAGAAQVDARALTADLTWEAACRHVAPALELLWRPIPQ